jgi:DNA-binding Xre family transcriptional regulator
MSIVNTIAALATAQGCKNAYEFWKTTGLSQATAYRLYNNPDAFPSKETQEVICKAFDAQPGDFLHYVADEAEDE